VRGMTERREPGLLCHDRTDKRRRSNDETIRGLPQHRKASDVIDVCIGEKDLRKRRRAQMLRLERSVRFDLLCNIG